MSGTSRQRGQLELERSEAAPPQRSQASGLLALLTPLGLFALAMAVRALPYPTVFTPDRIVFFGMDAYYHMRRVIYSLHRFPEILSFDPYINFPHGAKPIWPPLFDAMVALVAWPFYSMGGEPAAEAAAVWVPPVLGGATVLALYFTALKFFDRTTATLSGVALCLLSAHFWYSQIGFVDHHAAVAFVSTLVLASTMSLLAKLSQPGEQRVARGPVVFTGLCLAIALLLWPGSLLHVALAEAALLAFLLTRSDQQAAVRSAAAMALLNAVALASVLPFTATASWPQWGNYSPTVLSRFQPWFFAALALHALGCWSLWRRGAAIATARRFAQAVGLGAALLVASALLLPDLLQGATDAWQWLAKDEAFQASVAESMPLFELNGAFSRRIAEGRLSYFIYLLPLAVGAMAWWARRRDDSAAFWFFAAWTLGLLAVTLVQRRFFNSLSVALALTLAWSVCGVAAHATRLAAGSMGTTRGGAVVRASVFFAVALGLLAVALSSVWETYRLPVANFALARRGQAPPTRQAGPDLAGLLQVAEWLRHNTPATAGYHQARTRDGALARPEYGILARSGSGHVLEYAARRPTLSNNFGDDIGIDNFEAVGRYFRSTDEALSLRIADELTARYVVINESNPSARNRNSLASRLVRGDGSGLARHRLVFETSTLGRGASARRHKIFEIVPGALLVGRAPAATTVQARLDLRTNRKRKVVYRASAKANSEGWYRFRLPHATPGSERPNVADSRSGEADCCSESISAYRIELSGRSVLVEVSEEQVQSGETLTGPDFGS